MAPCRPAPACRAVLDQADEIAPQRSRASDGICASSFHTKANPGSDHEPHVIFNRKGYATAVDLTDDKAGGMDADAWAEHLRTTRDPRVKYVICNRRMFSSYPTSTCLAWRWRAYTGPNPHESHTHLSILPTALNDTRPWFPRLTSATPLEDDMPAPNHVTGVLPASKGSWVLTFDGGVRAVKGATFYGSYPGLKPEHRQGPQGFYVITERDDGKAGYMLIRVDGARYRFGPETAP